MSSFVTRGFCLLAAVFISQAWTEASNPVVKAEKIKSVPVIDGKLDEACWKSATPVDKFVINNANVPSTLGTVAYVLYDDSSLYIGVRCPDKNAPALKKIEKLKRDSGDVFRTDCVEIMIDPENSKNDFFHIGINAAGAVADRACTQGGFVGDMKWDGDFTAASYIGEDFWSCELAIPFYSLSITPKVKSIWGINICREKKNPNEDSSIAKEGAFNIAGSFAELTGLNVDFSSYCYNIININTDTNPDSSGQMNIDMKVNIENSTGKDRELLMEVNLVSPVGKTFIKKKTEILKKAETRDIAFDKINVSEQGKYPCEFRIIDPSTKQTYAIKKTFVNIEYSAIVITFIEPWYKDAIFESQKLKDVVFSVSPKMSKDKTDNTTLTAGIRKASDKSVIVSRQIEKTQPVNDFKFPADKLPYGTLEVFAQLQNNKDDAVIAEVSRTLRKLESKKGEVWPSGDLKWHIDGKPTFMLGGWNYKEDYIKDYNMFSVEMPECGFIDTGLIGVIISTCKGLKGKDYLDPAEIKSIRDYVNSVKNKGHLFAYYLSDEPEGNGTNAKALTQAYNIIVDEDPYHPVIVSNDTVGGLKDFAYAADINGLHPYPAILKDKEMNDLSVVIVFTEEGVKLFDKLEHKQSIFYLHPGFSFGDYGSVNSRVANYKEHRNQDLLSLICGAQGIIQFNRAVAHYPELYIGMPELAKEQKYLGKVILSPESKLKAESSSQSSKIILKELDGNVYILACNAQMEPEKIKINIPGIEKIGKKLNVISENRSVSLNKSSIEDQFGPFEVHVYTTSDEKTGLLSIKEICDKIEKANSERKKQGNLAYQRYEGDGVKITASSNAASQYRRIDAALWHVVDGVTNTSADKYKHLAWHDNTPGEFPDWLEVQLPKTEEIGRVVVYPYEKSLKDYSVQGFISGEWKDLDKVSNKNDNMIEHKFSPVKTDRVRIYITGANGKNSEINEIEIYGPEKKNKN